MDRPLLGVCEAYFTFQPQELGKTEWQAFGEHLPPNTLVHKIHELPKHKLCYNVSFPFSMDFVIQHGGDLGIVIDSIHEELGPFLADAVSFTKAVFLWCPNPEEEEIKYVTSFMIKEGQGEHLFN